MQTQATAAKIPSDLSRVHLCKGVGSGKAGERCAIQEVRHWLKLDAKTDAIPECVSRVIGRFVIRFQDGLDDETRDRLIVPLLPRLIGSAASEAVERRRAWMGADWVMREVAPIWMDESPELAEHAAALRALPEITDKASADAAAKVRAATSSAAWNLRCAKREALSTMKNKYADAAAYAAAAAAAYAYAYAAAAYAYAYAADADAAAYAYAYAADAYAYADAAYAYADAAADATRASLRSALLAKMRPTRVKVWESGARLIERMLDVTEENVA